jgi:hypothetical protein
MESLLRLYKELGTLSSNSEARQFNIMKVVAISFQCVFNLLLSKAPD